MPKHLKELKGFTSGTITTASESDISEEASVYSLNVEPISELGVLKAIGKDKYWGSSIYDIGGGDNGENQENKITTNIDPTIEVPFTIALSYNTSYNEQILTGFYYRIEVTSTTTYNFGYSNGDTNPSSLTYFTGISVSTTEANIHSTGTVKITFSANPLNANQVGVYEFFILPKNIKANNMALVNNKDGLDIIYSSTLLNTQTDDEGITTTTGNTYFNLVKDIYEDNPEFSLNSQSPAISALSTSFTSKNGNLHIGTGNKLGNIPKWIGYPKNKQFGTLPTTQDGGFKPLGEDDKELPLLLDAECFNAEKKNMEIYSVDKVVSLYLNNSNLADRNSISNYKYGISVGKPYIYRIGCNDSSLDYAGGSGSHDGAVVISQAFSFNIASICASKWLQGHAWIVEEGTNKIKLINLIHDDALTTLSSDTSNTNSWFDVVNRVTLPITPSWREEYKPDETSSYEPPRYKSPPDSATITDILETGTNLTYGRVWILYNNNGSPFEEDDRFVFCSEFKIGADGISSLDSGQLITTNYYFLDKSPVMAKCVEFELEDFVGANATGKFIRNPDTVKFTNAEGFGGSWFIVRQGYNDLKYRTNEDGEPEWSSWQSAEDFTEDVSYISLGYGAGWFNGVAVTPHRFGLQDSFNSNTYGLQTASGDYLHVVSVLAKSDYKFVDYGGSLSCVNNGLLDSSWSKDIDQHKTYHRTVDMDLFLLTLPFNNNEGSKYYYDYTPDSMSDPNTTGLLIGDNEGRHIKRLTGVPFSFEDVNNYNLVNVKYDDEGNDRGTDPASNAEWNATNQLFLFISYNDPNTSNQSKIYVGSYFNDTSVTGTKTYVDIEKIQDKVTAVNTDDNNTILTDSSSVNFINPVIHTSFIDDTTDKFTTRVYSRSGALKNGEIDSEFTSDADHFSDNVTNKKQHVHSITLTENGSSGSFALGDIYYYNIAYVYDGNQVSPLMGSYSQITITSTDRESITITLKLDKATLNQRISHIYLFRRLNTQDEFQLVKELSLSSGWGEEVLDDGKIYKTRQIQDDNSAGANYFEVAGIDEFISSSIVNYKLSERYGMYHFVGDIFIPQIAEEHNNWILRSQPDKFDTFNWIPTSGDMIQLSNPPICIKMFNGKLYAFDNSNMYIINPSDFFIESESVGYGCISEKSIIVSDIGMFFADKNSIYLHNGQMIEPIGSQILEGTYGYSNRSASFDPMCAFDSSRNSFLIAIKVSGNYYVWSYNLSLKRWDMWEISEPYSFLQGRDGEVLYSGKTKSGSLTFDSLIKYTGSSTKRSYSWKSKKLTMEEDTQDKIFKRVRIAGTTSDV